MLTYFRIIAEEASSGTRLTAVEAAPENRSSYPQEPNTVESRLLLDQAICVVPRAPIRVLLSQ